MNEKDKKRRALWDRFEEVEDILQQLKAAVQNDIEYTRTEIEEFKYKDVELVDSLCTLLNETEDFMKDHLKED